MRFDFDLFNRENFLYRCDLGVLFCPDHNIVEKKHSNESARPIFLDISDNFSFFVSFKIKNTKTK